MTKKLSKEEALRQLTELQMIANNVKKEKFDEEYKILLVVEGHSASSGIRTSRDSAVIGVLALRGKTTSFSDEVWDYKGIN